MEVWNHMHLWALKCFLGTSPFLGRRLFIKISNLLIQNTPQDEEVFSSLKLRPFRWNFDTFFGRMLAPWLLTCCLGNGSEKWWLREETLPAHRMLHVSKLITTSFKSRDLVSQKLVYKKEESLLPNLHSIFTFSFYLHLLYLTDLNAC